jgi:glycosyltransferase involved in cell wall biosynthesis
MNVIVCIPAFNEEKIIGNLVKDCLNYCDSVLVCDDGSFDNTFDNAKKSGATVIKHSKNKGKGAALKTLFEYVVQNDFDTVITIDGDGQFLPSEIPKLVTTIRENNFDIVVGNRFNSKSEMPKYRQIGNSLLDKITNLASDSSLSDTQSGFRSYSKQAIKKISFNNDGFAADSEILVDAIKNNLKIGAVNVTVLYKTGTKTSTMNPFSHTVRVVSSLVELISLRRPLLFIGVPSIFFVFLGIYFLVNVAILFNETRYFSVPSTVLSVVTLSIGLIFFMMSIILFSISKIHKIR